VKLRLRKSFTVVMLDMLRLSRKTDTWAQRDVIKYIRSSIALDGLVRRCAPGIGLDRHVERACARYMTWGMTAISPSRLLAGSADGPRRLLASGHRAAALLERVEHGELSIRAELGNPESGGGGHRRWNAVVAVLLLVFALTVRGEPSAFGLNLFTAQTLLLATALGWLAGPVHGLT